MDSEPPELITLSFLPLFFMISSGDISAIFILIILIICSGLVSGSEVAYFSLGPIQIKDLEEEDSKSSRRIMALLSDPKKLLATILIANNFINIAIVIVSDYLIGKLLGDTVLNAIGARFYEWMPIMQANTWSSLINFLITVLGVTFILVLFGEVAPKIYANMANMKMVRAMSLPLTVLNNLLSPFSNILVRWGTRIEDRVNSNYQNNSIREDLDKAIDLTVSDSDQSGQEAEILKGIVKFGDVRVKQIMKSRVDVVGIESSENFSEVLKIVRDNGYSRLPVYEEDFDKVIGILYVKDLLGYTGEGKDFDWLKLIRDQVLYVPESKKIDDLLREFQLKRMHMAIVVDEYGGSCGIVTLEDIMEEVIGDIKDEFDEDEEVEYVKLDNQNFIFDGKMLLNDVLRITGLPSDIFDEIKGDSDSLAGLIIEKIGHLPKPETEVEIGNIKFTVISTTAKRIEKVNLRIESHEA